MKTILIALAFVSIASTAAEMNPAQALQTLRAVTDKAALVAADHRIVEQAYKVLADHISKHAESGKKGKDDGSSK